MKFNRRILKFNFPTVKLNIRTKLIGAFLVVIVLAVAVGIFALVQMYSIFRVGDYVNANTVPTVELIGQMQLKINNYRSQELQHIVAVDADQRQITLVMLS